MISLRVLYIILDTSAFSDTWFANVFSKSVAPLFILLTVLDQKFLILMKSNLSICSFMGHASSGAIPKKFLPTPWSQRFSSRCFIYLGFTLRSIVHFENLILCIVQSTDRSLFFCLWICNCSSTICWKDYPFALYCLCWKLLVQRSMGLFLVSWFCSIHSSIFMPVSHHIDL